MTAPPFSIAWRTHQALPGVYGWFISNVLQAVGRDQGARVTSWYRDRETNARAGGHPESQHLVGLGLDVVVTDPEIVVARARQLGLGAVAEPSHVHLQALPPGTLARLRLI